MTKERYIYKVDYKLPHLSKPQRFNHHLLEIVDSLIFIFTFGNYAGRMAENYFWKHVGIQLQKAKDKRDGMTSSSADEECIGCGETGDGTPFLDKYGYCTLCADEIRQEEDK